MHRLHTVILNDKVVCVCVCVVAVFLKPVLGYMWERSGVCVCVCVCVVAVAVFLKPVRVICGKDLELCMSLSVYLSVAC